MPSVFGIGFEYYIACGIGVFVLYFKLLSDGKGVMRFLPHIKKGWARKPWPRFIDAMIFVIVGAIVAALLTQPNNYQQALAAGLGLTGLLSGFTGGIS